MKRSSITQIWFMVDGSLGGELIRSHSTDLFVHMLSGNDCDRLQLLIYYLPLRKRED